ncbi:MAG: hypothetical protein QXO16_06380 [Archaeoglobaceae archaeon]
MDEESIRYLILHELVRYKLKSKYHSAEFYRQLHEKVDEEKARDLERKVLTSLLELNNIL